MGIKDLFNNIPDIYQRIQQSLGKHTVREIDIKICMLGARGVGKTSVLTSIFYDGNSKDGFYGTKIRLYATAETSAELTKKHDSLRDVFEHRENIAAIGGTFGVSEHKLLLGMLGEKPNINLLITDYPGERVETERQYVAERVKESDVVLVAIDTPYLMENNGAFDEEKNRTTLIKDFLIENIGNLKEKIVLFVPLKCEKYLDLKRKSPERQDLSMALCDKVVAAYKEVIDKLKSQENVAIAITPILTMGGVVFDHFEINNEGGQGALYKFYDGETPDGIKAKYEPLFCSQPIFYLLSFVTRQYKMRRKSADLLGQFFQIFENVDEFFDEIVKVDKRRLSGTYGYRVLAGEDLFFSKNI